MDDLQKIITTLEMTPNKVIDFGPPLIYPLLCQAYTVEKLTLWEKTTEHRFDVIPLRANQMHRARIEGILYRLTDEELKWLDKKRCVGVEYERKRIPVFVPYQKSDGSFHQIYAYLYMGMNSHWLDQIGWDTKTWARNSAFRLAQTWPDKHPLLNHRFKFLPPIEERAHTVGTLTEKMRKYIRRRNRAEARRLFWMQIRRKAIEFVNDE